MPGLMYPVFGCMLCNSSLIQWNMNDSWASSQTSSGPKINTVMYKSLLLYLSKMKTYIVFFSHNIDNCTIIKISFIWPNQTNDDMRLTSFLHITFTQYTYHRLQESILTCVRNFDITADTHRYKSIGSAL